MAASDAPPHPNRSRKTDRLSQRLENLERQLSRLTDLLAEQTVSRKRRRRQFTIRFMLTAFLAFALLFAWFGNIYHQSRQQAAAVDRLIGEGVFVMHSPRRSPLVALMPGDLKSPPAILVDWLGSDFFRAVTNVSTKSSPTVDQHQSKTEVIDSLSALSQLKRLRLVNMQLKTSDLRALADLDQLQSLDISHTVLDFGAMPWLRDKPLRWFNASHTKLSDRALYDLSHCRELQQLFLERTAISDNGLKHLHSMSQLRYLNLKRAPVSAAAVKRLSDALPGCVIEWEPLVFLSDGRVDGRAARKSRVKYGRGIPDDPRAERRAIAPMDNAPTRVWASPSWQPQQSYGINYPYTIDVF